MLPEDHQRFADSMAGLCAVFGVELDHVLLDAYWIALSDWDINDFQKACVYLLKMSKFMPRPEAFTTLQRAALMSAGEAWEIVLERCGCWRGGPTPGGAIDKAVQAIGGYRVIAFANLETQMHFLQKRFCDEYAIALEREEITRQFPALGAPNANIEEQKKLSGMIESTVKSLLNNNPVSTMQSEEPCQLMSTNSSLNLTEASSRRNYQQPSAMLLAPSSITTRKEK